MVHDEYNSGYNDGERKLHTSEMLMLRWARGKTRQYDQGRKVDIWKEAQVYPIAEFLREMLRWFGRVQRRDIYEATRNILKVAIDGKQN